MNIFVTRALPDRFRRALTEAGHTVSEWTEKRDLSAQELMAACLVADALFSVGKNAIDCAFLDACSHLRVIALCSVGYDNVDIGEATRRGIPIGNTPGVLSKATADTAFLLMQSVARKAFHKHKEILRGHWGFFDPMSDLGIELRGKTLGIFGLGRIGMELARSCRSAFDMPVIYHNRGHNEEAEKELGAQRVTFDELLRQSDVLSVHANLSKETTGIFNRDAFSRMKTSSIFINTARGAIHHESDLYRALEEGLIWGAGLDVTHPEPMDPSHPLLQMPNVAVLPHIGSATLETRTAMMELTVENILAGLDGRRLPYCVNPQVYDQRDPLG